MDDYGRIERVIRHLDAHHVAQPRLAELAAVAGLSESHFHQLFRRWAGVTPKDFLQSLTVEHARARLQNSASVLETALETGLSGPGRLHDLLVAWEAATPGELKRGGAGVVVGWGRAESPFGDCSLGWTGRGLCHVAFYDGPEPDGVPERLLKDWPRAELRRDDREARRWAEGMFGGEAGPGPGLRAHVRGTAFQVSVWRALVRIPEGCVATYGRIARAIGSEGAVRAVGTACGANPVAWLIPCHRVIRETGVVQGYRWGSDRKRAMLAWEAVRPSAGAPSHR